MSAFFNKIVNLHSKIKQTKTISVINGILSSPYGITFVAFFALFANMFSLELLMFSISVLICVYVSLFGDDFLPLMPLFVFCYISVSSDNNPGNNSNSIFYNTPCIVYMFVIVAIAVISLLLRIGFDKNMGYKKLFTQKRSLLWGVCALGLAYFLSGIGHSNYKNIVGNNLLFALLQFLSIFLLYFIFTATINWKKAPKDYFAWFGLILGLTILLQIVFIYINVDVVVDGIIKRGRINTGWGISNNIGALLATTIPFAFYLACKKKHNYIFLILATLLLFGTFLTGSRASILGGLFIYLVSLVISFIKAEHKKSFRISTAVLVGVCLIFGLVFMKSISKIFTNILNAFANIKNDERLNLYKNGWKAFLASPIFGQSFYPSGYIPYQASNVDSFTSLFPPRWHNTIIQLLASCGILGLIAYSYHRIQTIILFCKKPTMEKSFIGLSILVLLLTSLLDCHFFNIGPVLFYSMGLAFAEKINEEPEVIVEVKDEKIEDKKEDDVEESQKETESKKIAEK